MCSHDNKKFQEYRKETPKSGRPKKFSDQDERSIIIKSRQNPSLSLRNLAAEFKTIKNEHTVSRETVRRILHNRGIDSYVAQRKSLKKILQQ